MIVDDFSAMIHEWECCPELIFTILENTNVKNCDALENINFIFNGPRARALKLNRAHAIQCKKSAFKEQNS